LPFPFLITRCLSLHGNDLRAYLLPHYELNGSPSTLGRGSTCHICGNTYLRDYYICCNTKSSGSGRSFSGVASHYGNESGSRTASGQRFNQNAMTAAHRSLPFGTKLRVTHGDRSVVVTINDRGPFIRGRVLDLSTGAARAIGLGGLGRVVAEVI
jgi:rare lipoprotein A (peptidoglycan hydrolase)